MDVHPPHHPLLTWRDFFIHIATITIGLLIAIALEQSVESLHHRHLRLETRENLRTEVDENRQTLAKDLKALTSEKQMLESDIAVLLQLRAGKPIPPDSLHFDWYWSSMSGSAWQTARETTALALFPIEQVQGYSDVYGQQEHVNAAGIALSAEITKADIPLRIEPSLAALSPTQIDGILRDCAASLNQLDYLHDLIDTLVRNYDQALRVL